MKDKYHIIMSTNTVRTFDKISTYVHDKNTRQIGHRKNVYQHNKGYILKIHSKHSML